MSKTKNPTIDRHMPEAVHHVADRLREARALLAEAETAASEAWATYQAQLRQNTPKPEEYRTRWEAAQADIESRRLACQLLESDLTAVLRDLAEGAHRPGSPFRDAQTEDHRAALAAEGARRDMVREAVDLLQRAASIGAEELGSPRTAAAESEYRALAELLPDHAVDLIARCRVSRVSLPGSAPLLHEVILRLRGATVPIN